MGEDNDKGEVNKTTTSNNQYAEAVPESMSWTLKPPAKKELTEEQKELKRKEQ